MGYRGKLKERERARELRAAGMSLLEIARQLGVSKSSVSLWVRDMDVKIDQRRAGWWTTQNPHPAAVRKQAEIDCCNANGVTRLGALDDQAFLAAGVALYAGEGSKTDGDLSMANSNPELIKFFLCWLRRFFVIDATRLRVTLYLHQGLDLEAAQRFWERETGIPISQFRKPYRAVPDVGIRHNKLEFGCCTVSYSCSRTHREVMGLVRALLSSASHSGVAQPAERLTVNQDVVGSSPTPGALSEGPLGPVAQWSEQGTHNP